MLPQNKPYLIGETAFHHQGDFQFLKNLIDNGVEAGVDAIKVHLLLNLDNYFIKDHEAYGALKQWMLTEKQWSEIFNYNESHAVDTIALCNDPESIDFILKQKAKSIKAIEIHATGLNDYFLLEKAAKFDGTVILGVGGSTIDEIEYAIEVLNSLNQHDIFLMYGFQNYPTRHEDINLSKMLKLKNLFGLPIGYADHTDPLNEFNETISTLGMTMGANVCEKHFTHLFGEKRIDSQAAINLDQLKNLKKLMNVIHSTLGNGKLKMSDSELNYGNTGPMKKAIVAKKSIKKGETISLDQIGFKRTNESTYILQSFLPKLIGLKATEDIKLDEFIDFSKVSYEFKKADSSQFKANK